MIDFEERLRRDLQAAVEHVATEVGPPASLGSEIRRRRLRRRAPVLAAVAAFVTGGVALWSTLGDEGNEQVADIPDVSVVSEPTTVAADIADESLALGGSGALSCVEMYSEETLSRRAFAFDGTVVSIGEPDPASPEPALDVAVVFEVSEWFAGGREQQVTVDMFPPGAVTSAGEAGYDVGSRLLISGEPRFGGEPLDDAVAWPCGFSRTYSTEEAAMWRTAFGG